MQPNQPNQPNPQPHDYSIDYLDQISAPTKRTVAPNPFVLVIIIGVGLLAIIGFAIMMFGGSGNSQTEKVTQIYLRTQTLQKIADTEQRQLRDNDLRSTNAAFSLYLSNLLRDMKDPMDKLKIVTEKIPKTLTAKETALTTEVNAKFEEARLNVVLDRTYAREMAYQISILRSMMASLYKATGNQSLKTILGTSDPSLAQTAKSLSDFSGS